MYLNKCVILFAAFALGACSSVNATLRVPALFSDKKAYVQARNLYEQGQYDQAIEQLTAYIYKADNVKRREARAYRLLGMSYAQKGKLSKALETYLEALEFHPKNIPLLVRAAELYQQTGLTDRSMELYERALAEEPDNLSALSGQADNYRTMGFYSRAREFYDRFFALNPNAAAQYRARYADTFLNQRNYRQAFINITMALAQNNAAPDFWLISARSLYGLGRTEEALYDLDLALSLAPDRYDLLATKALMLYHDGRYDLSRQTARQMLQISPENQLALFIEALNLRALGDTAQTQKILAQITALNDGSFIGKTAAQWNASLSR